MDHPYVLIVDDDPEALETTGRWIGSMGIPVSLTSDRIKALEHLNQRKPALVVLDLMLPRMDGFIVLAYLKLDPEKRDIPVIVLTASALVEAQEADLRNVVVDVVRKGDNVPEMVGRIIDVHLESIPSP